MEKTLKLILQAVALSTVSFATLLVLFFYLFGYTQVGRFLPVRDEDEQLHNLVFDSKTGNKCSTYSPSKEDVEFRKTFSAIRNHDKLDSVTLTRFDAFKSAAKENEDAYLNRTYFIAYGPCPR